MKKSLLVVLSLAFVFVLAACGSSSGDGDVTSLTMGFVPSQDADKIADTVEPLQERLSEILDVDIDARVMTDFVGLVEAMRTGQVDIGFLPPFGFVQAEERANVEVILKAVRDGETSYRAQYSIRNDADLEHIQSLEDLVNEEGIRWAYADPTSASGFLFPASQLLGLGVEDLDAHFSQLVVGGHDTALIALLNNDADIATTYEDARDRVEQDYADVKERVRVLGFTDPIPNDTISVREGLSDEWTQKIKEAFLSFNDDEEMIQVMSDVYNWTGIAEAKSEDYEIVRETYRNFEEQLAE
ncbi:phosphate/phosphite/phosphonate ABC transporter substrate-binding protein [Bacillus horti]|uniref:Phosphonate transport system substrate-binding protein n=1 Tax=Caldalkalibacillus horti TaxID=77523 RepID=A0ABT9W3F9_9BACI|nr:phosphate/phosphite/phosphonate ABC transporter substrate-binding protein [Bacillus horti]MDQ0167778.1 phosphonate transport system substrate-binding protein [Bacillus horti]